MNEQKELETATPKEPDGWRHRWFLDNPQRIPVVYRRVCLWFFADAVNDPDHTWWLRHNTGFKFNAVVCLVVCLALIGLWYMGVFHLLGNWLIHVFQRRFGQTSICGKPIKTKHSVHHLSSLMDVTTWKGAFPAPYANITDRDLQRGFIKLAYPNQLSDIVIDLGNVQTRMSEMSANYSCACAADLFIPYNIFAFNGKVYWRIQQPWITQPYGRSACAGVPDLVSADGAKGHVVHKLCMEKDAKGELVTLGKGVLCCMEFCLRSQGIFQ